MPRFTNGLINLRRKKVVVCIVIYTIWKKGNSTMMVQYKGISYLVSSPATRFNAYKVF